MVEKYTIFVCFIPIFLYGCFIPIHILMSNANESSPSGCGSSDTDDDQNLAVLQDAQHLIEEVFFEFKHSWREMTLEKQQWICEAIEEIYDALNVQ